jgi:hypothetical protein
MPLDYVTVDQLTFSRSDVLKLMTFLLLGLIAATAIYAVTLRSLHDHTGPESQAGRVEPPAAVPASVSRTAGDRTNAVESQR